MRVIITLQHVRINEVLSELIKKGLKVDTVLEEIGAITGEIVEEKLSTLAKIKGITVEPEQSVQLPPPDSPLQ